MALPQRRSPAALLAGTSLILVAGLAVTSLGDAAPGGARRRSDAEAPKPIRVLLLGDSLIATEFGLELQQLLNETPGYVCKRRARSATGLARQDVFDWIRASRLAVALRRPELAIVLIGSNDVQDVVPPATGRGRPRPFRRVNWEQPGWTAAYRARADKLLDQVADPRREVLWLDLPPMRSRSLDKKLRRVRQAQRAAVRARPRDADFLALLPLMKSLGTRQQTWRQRWRRYRRDGVHFGKRGSRVLAQMILPVIHAMALRVYLHRIQAP